MNEWIRAQMEKGFTDLKGLQLTATIPLRDQIVNDAVARFLVNPPAPPPAGFDLRNLLAFVRRAQVRSTEGMVVVDLEIRV